MLPAGPLTAGGQRTDLSQANWRVLRRKLWHLVAGSRSGVPRRIVLCSVIALCTKLASTLHRAMLGCTPRVSGFVRLGLESGLRSRIAGWRYLMHLVGLIALCIDIALCIGQGRG